MHRERRWVGARIDYCDHKGSIPSKPIPYVITFIPRKNWSWVKNGSNRTTSALGISALDNSNVSSYVKTKIHQCVYPCEKLYAFVQVPEYTQMSRRGL